MIQILTIEMSKAYRALLSLVSFGFLWILPVAPSNSVMMFTSMPRMPPRSWWNVDASHTSRLDDNTSPCDFCRVEPLFQMSIRPRGGASLAYCVHAVTVRDVSHCPAFTAQSPGYWSTLQAGIIKLGITYLSNIPDGSISYVSNRESINKHL